MRRIRQIMGSSSSFLPGSYTSKGSNHQIVGDGFYAMRSILSLTVTSFGRKKKRSQVHTRFTRRFTQRFARSFTYYWNVSSYMFYGERLKINRHSWPEMRRHTKIFWKVLIRSWKVMIFAIGLRAIKTSTELIQRKHQSTIRSSPISKWKIASI